jgi:hyperosmotically inducible protein
MNRNRTLLIAVGIGIAIGSGGGIAYADSTDPSAPTPHSDSIGAAIDDTAITAKVKAKLLDDARLKDSKISVTTTNGVVTLEGKSSGSDAKSAAEQLAQSVGGVKSVDDQLTTPASSEASAKTQKAMTQTKRAVSDSWITTKVKSQLMADSISKGFDVSVQTKHGVVMLKGTLANQDAVDHVKDIAEKVKGVKSVDTTALVVASS